MSYNLFLDDERFPDQVRWVKLPSVGFTIVRSYDEFVENILDNGRVPTFVTFDHDLCDAHYCAMAQEVESYTHDDGDLVKTFDYGPEKTGFECAKWLVEFCHEANVKFPDYEVHSLNPVGAKRIRDYIEDAKKNGFIF